MDKQFWQGKRVFMTGHTGFKGSWLSLWLQYIGAKVTGYALNPPTTPSMFEVAEVARGMTSVVGDVRDLQALTESLCDADPEIVFHMAAQPLVRYSYGNPVETYATNVMGTVHLLEAVRQAPSVKAVVNVTSDKCYENREWVWGYRENESMGGHDPYSNSKGCAELVTSAYRSSYFGSDKSSVALASARAGNVVGGGDWALERLVPDILRALEKCEPVLIRNPNAIRPWQHVLEPLSGYLMLAERLYTHGETYAEGWNFGPREEDARPVQWIVEHLCNIWGNGNSWMLQPGDKPHEANFLKLEISKARQRLDWEPRWSLETALKHISDWHQGWLSGQNMREHSLRQICTFQRAA